MRTAKVSGARKRPCTCVCAIGHLAWQMASLELADTPVGCVAYWPVATWPAGMHTAAAGRPLARDPACCVQAPTTYSYRPTGLYVLLRTSRPQLLVPWYVCVVTVRQRPWQLLRPAGRSCRCCMRAVDQGAGRFVSPAYGTAVTYQVTRRLGTCRL